MAWRAVARSQQRPIPSRAPARDFLLAALTAFGAASPAAAQVSASASIDSDDRFRGHSLSQGRPVASLDLSYDDGSGLYAGATGSAVATSSDGLQPLSVQAYAGWAKTLSRTATLDLGLTTTRYSRFYSGGRPSGYTEAYAGVIVGSIAAHLRYAPEYFRGKSATIYGDLGSDFRLTSRLHVQGHLGVLVSPGPAPSWIDRHAAYDWRIGLSRQTGHLGLHVSYSGGGPGNDYYGDRSHRRNAVVLGASYIF